MNQNSRQTIHITIVVQDKTYPETARHSAGVDSSDGEESEEFQCRAAEAAGSFSFPPRGMVSHDDGELER